MAEPKKAVDTAPYRTAAEETFWKRIELSPALPPALRAADAIFAVLGSIVPRVPAGVGEELVAALPPELHPRLHPLVSADDRSEPHRDLAPYLDEMTQRLRLDRVPAVVLAIAVLAATAELLDPDQLDRLEEELPMELMSWRSRGRG